MKKYQEKLDIVDENDNVIGQDTRENVHKNGLLHREIHVIIYNDEGKILFQKRSANVDTHPGVFTSAATGHVDLGDTYDKTVIKELEEETGIRAILEDLIFVKKVRSKTHDEISNTINNKFTSIYSYKLKKTDVLRLEKGKATSFKFWSLNDILNFSEEDRQKFISTVVSDEWMKIYKGLLNK